MITHCFHLLLVISQVVCFYIILTPVSQMLVHFHSMCCLFMVYSLLFVCYAARLCLLGFWTCLPLWLLSLFLQVCMWFFFFFLSSFNLSPWLNCLVVGLYVLLCFVRLSTLNYTPCLCSVFIILKILIKKIPCLCLHIRVLPVSWSSQNWFYLLLSRGGSCRTSRLWQDGRTRSTSVLSFWAPVREHPQRGVPPDCFSESQTINWTGPPSATARGYTCSSYQGF